MQNDKTDSDNEAWGHSIRDKNDEVAQYIRDQAAMITEWNQMCEQKNNTIDTIVSTLCDIDSSNDDADMKSENIMRQYISTSDDDAALCIRTLLHQILMLEDMGSKMPRLGKKSINNTLEKEHCKMERELQIKQRLLAKLVARFQTTV
jgi:hypothetical protein